MTAAAFEPTPKFPIWRSIKAAFGHIFENPGAFLAAITLPLLASIVLAALMPTVPTRLGQVLLGTAVSLVPLSLFGLVWYRFLLLQHEEARPRLFPRLGRPFAPFLGYSLVLAVIALPRSIVAGQESSNATESQLIVALTIALFLVTGYVKTRLSFVLPWIAVEEAARLAASWRATRGNGLRILAANLVVIVPASLPSGLVRGIFHEDLPAMESGQAAWETAPLVSLMVARQLSLYLLAALSIGVMAEAFKHCTGWDKGPRQDILERFE